MRKSIFKRELEHCFKLFNLSDKEQNDILNRLFENPLSTTKQYLLKKEFDSIDKIDILLKSILQNDEFISDVKTLFEINDDLELPVNLREQLARKEQIVLFVGAGVSKLLGLPLWGELAKKSIKYLYENKLITFSEAEKIIDENNSPKQKLSIFHDILPKEKSKEFYERCFTPGKERFNKNPYDLLVELRCPKFSLNLDNEFWNALEKRRTEEYKPIHIYSGFNKGMPISLDSIYQIHGSYKNIENYSIITMRDYLNYYYNDIRLREFLKKIFNEYIALFIGLGMEEFELLQDLVKSKKGHHVLISTYLNDTNLLRVKKEYFSRSLGIYAHGYYLDFNGYDRLYDVIDSWVKQIKFEMQGDFYHKIGEFNDVKL